MQIKLNIVLSIAVLSVYMNGLNGTPLTSGKNLNNFKNHPWQILQRSSGTNCGIVYTLLCLKLDAVSFVERLADSGEYPIFPGVTILKEQDTNKTEDARKVAELARKYPDDLNKRLKSYVYYKFLSYLDTHSVNLKITGNQGTEVSRGNPSIWTEASKRRFWETVMMVKSTLMTLLLGKLAFKTGLSLLFSTAAISLAGFMALQIFAMGNQGFDLFAKLGSPSNSNGWQGNSDNGAYTNGFNGGWPNNNGWSGSSDHGGNTNGFNGGWPSGNGNGGGGYPGNGPSGAGYNVPFYDDFRSGGPYSRIGHQDDSLDSKTTKRNEKSSNLKMSNAFYYERR